MALTNFKQHLIDSINLERGSLLLIMLFSLNTFLIFYQMIDLNDTNTSALYKILKAILYYFGGLAISLSITILIGLIPTKLLRRLFLGAWLTFYAIVFVADLFLLKNFGSMFDQTKMEILLGTNPYTVREFLSIYLGFSGILGIAISIILLYFFLRRADYFLGKLSFLPKLIIIVLSISYLAFSTLLAFSNLIGHIFINKNVDELRVARFYCITTLLRIGNDYQNAVKSLGNTEIITAALDSSTEEVTSNDADKVSIIFILGESTDRNKMSAYGYKNETTPLLTQRIANGETILFTDTIACANSTATAMARIFSFADKNTKSPWYERSCLIDIMNKAGFYTAWLSNQSPSNHFGNMDSVLAARSTEFAFTTLEGSDAVLSARPHDDKLLPLLDESLAKNSYDKNFYVVHLTGTHEEFRLRFPQEFARFTAGDETAATEKWREVQADYDNAVLYNDYIVDEIINRFKDKNAVVIYLSDHGDDVYDDERGFMGHSGEETRSRHMVEIPFFVYGSPSFWQSHENLKAELLAAKDRPYSTENVIHFIMDLANVKSTSYNSQKSILNPNNIYQNQPRIYGGKPYFK